MSYKKSLFLFHRDLSVEDNILLEQCIKQSDEVFLAFIFTPEQVTKKNKYFNVRVIKFMIECLEYLSQDLHVNYYYGKTDLCLKSIIKKYAIDALWENRDFSPYAKSREKLNAAVCEKFKINHILGETITIAPMGEFLKKNGKAFIKFTPFYKHATSIKPKTPIDLTKNTEFLKKVSKKKLATSETTDLSDFSSKYVFIGESISSNLSDESKGGTDESKNQIEYLGGRAEALKLLKIFLKNIDDYLKYRDIPSKNITSNLGPHFHFGTLSIREILYKTLDHKTKGAKEFIKQIYWREFYMYITNYVSTTYDKKAVTLKKFNNIEWSKKNYSEKYKQWKTGTTGVPIVDAGMRELLNTGMMHNRLRMICAMYLIHYLNIDWAEGEKWFANNLIDYDYPNNYGGWVWCAGTETHSNPYYRIFSMLSQNQRFDPKCEYIKKWCPEYKDLTPKDILKIYEPLKLDIIRKKRINYLSKLK